jgi:hypothetical protein
VILIWHRKLLSLARWQKLLLLLLPHLLAMLVLLLLLCPLQLLWLTTKTTRHLR